MPLSIRQASDLLGVNPTTLRHWADQGQVRSFRTPGGHRRFSENDLLAVFRGSSADASTGSGEARPSLPFDRAQGKLSAQGTSAPIDLPPHALARIRRRMSGARSNGADWVRELDEAEREDLRQHGRRLVAIASDYVAQAERRTALGHDAKEIGSHYGRVLAGHAMPFSRVLEAFIFFRDLLEEAAHARPAYRDAGPAEREEFQRHLSAVLDKVLLGAVNGYEASR